MMCDVMPTISEDGTMSGDGTEGSGEGKEMF